MHYNPFIALVIFLVVTAVLFLLFRPIKGWFWVIKNNLKINEKTVIEDILKQLYHYENSGKEANLDTLTGVLKTNEAVLIDVLQKMTINELVEFNGDSLKLTKSGRDYALRIVRVHRLWEKYLAEKTGFDKTEWHDRAERMEHILSNEETNLLATQLGNPTYDPHGDPIPTRLGKIVKVKGVSLSVLPVNTIGKITHIEDEPEVIYKQILAENIHIGSQIRVVENNAERIVFYSEGEEFKLGTYCCGKYYSSVVLEKEIIQEENTSRLSSLKENETAKIVGISKECRGENRRRLLDLGFVKGTPIKIDLMSPLSNPKAYL